MTTTSAAQDDWTRDLVPYPAKTDSGFEIPCRLLRPPASPDTDQKFPLVLFLHGAGERGDDNQAQLKHGIAEFHRRRDSHPCFVVVPQCPKEARWVEVDWNQKTGKGSFSAEPAPPLAAAWSAVEKLIREEQVDPNRIYVTGLSMGGYGTWFAAAHFRDQVAAAIPVCGGGDPEWADRYVGLPMWAVHGIKDTAVPIERTREMVRAIRDAGGELGLTEYPDVAHDSWTPFYGDDQTYVWLFRQKR